LFFQIEDGVAFALAGYDPTSEPAISCMAYNTIAKTVTFNTVCQEWRKAHPALNACNFFKTKFKAADKDLHHMESSGSAGYYGAASTAAQYTDPGAVLITTQATLGVGELALDEALANHALVTPSITVAISATNVSVMTTITSATTTHQRSY
jgi:hypothetical protein